MYEYMCIYIYTHIFYNSFEFFGTHQYSRGFRIKHIKRTYFSAIQFGCVFHVDLANDFIENFPYHDILNQLAPKTKSHTLTTNIWNTNQCPSSI